MAATFNDSQLVQGDDVFLYVFDTTGITAFSGISSANVISFATSCSLQLDGETIDTSNKMSCAWNSNIAGKNSYTVSADALYTDQTISGGANFNELFAKMAAREPVGWAMAKYTGDCDSNFAISTGSTIAAGYGLVTSLSLNAGNNEVASVSISIQGTGSIITE